MKNNNYVFINGKIFTSDEENLYADSFIVENGLISWVGKSSDMPANNYETVDLKNKRVIPGFVDAHMHPMMLAEFSKKISCLPPKINSIDELIEEIKCVRQQQGEGKWIEGWGYDEGKLAEHRSPNRYDLDKGAADVPISIVRTCGHIRCVNSKALELAGITKDTPDPQGGEIDRDENGEPTGILRENARNLVVEIMPQMTNDMLQEALLELGDLLSSQGIVAVSDMGNLDEGDYYKIYTDAVEKGFKQEVAMYYMWDLFAGNANFDIPKERYDKELQIRVAGLKLIADGSVSGHTAWTYEPYKGTDNYGVCVCADDNRESAIEFCKKNHCQLSFHAMGAKAIDQVINRFYNEEKWTEDETPFVRVEHVTEPTEDAINKAVEKKIAFVTQPIFLYAEIESYLENLGREWMQKTYPVKHMLEKGVKLAFSTDAPATSWAVPSDPFPCIKSAVTRVAYDGTDCGKQHAVDIETAIKLYTKESAEVAGFKNLGQIKKGYKASFAVLEQDILNMPKEEIDRVKISETYVNGELIFKKEDL